MRDCIVPKNIASLYQQAAERYEDRPAIAAREKGGDYVSTSYRELFAIGKNLATALIALDLQAREHVGIISSNRPEWIFADCAIQVAGAVNVPRGIESTEAEMNYILNHSGVRFVFIENAAVWEKFHSCLPSTSCVILMDASSWQDGTIAKYVLHDLIAQGAALRKAGDCRVEERISKILPEDLFTLIYTSGTTGLPKGVQLTHANAVSQIRDLPFDLQADDRALTILPVWHSYERVFELVVLSWGVVMYYTSLRAIAEDLKTVRPTVMCSAPRLWEGLYRRILLKLRSSSPFRRFIFHLAYLAARRVKLAESFFHGNALDIKGRTLPENVGLAIVHSLCWCIWFLPYCLFDKLVLKKIRAMIGGKFRGTISGGGALQTHVDEFFNFAGIPILEGYGLTETSPVLAVRTWKNLVIGTVGSPYPETEIRIVDLESNQILYPDFSRRDQGRGRIGEIHARGPQVMKGYYGDEATTAQVLHDGWLNTGDIGMMTFNDCLKIFGRSKDTIVLLSGENVEPLPLEACLLSSPLIEQCMIVGQDEKHLGALIVPSLEGLTAVGIIARSLKELADNRRVIQLIDAEIRQLINETNDFKPFEHIVSWRIVPKPFEVGDELTQTLKLKRYIITKKYAPLIHAMFADFVRQASMVSFGNH